MSFPNTKYPLGTVALYGPTDKQATKLVASIFPTCQKAPAAVKKWNTATGDIREDPAIQEQLSAFLNANSVAHAVVTEGVVGCPHEEGIDYPRGNPCPHCPFWSTQTRSSSTPKATPGRNDTCPCGSGKKFKKCCALNS